MAHGGSGIGRGVLCAHREGEEVVLGDYMGSGRLLFMDTAADWGEHAAAARLSRLLCVDGYAYAHEGRVFWSHVGDRQRELRIDDAAFGDITGSGGGHRRGAGCGYAGASDPARAGRGIVPQQERRVGDGRPVAGGDRHSVRLLCRPSERDPTARRAEGVQFEAGGISRHFVRDIFLRHGLCHGRGVADEGGCASPGGEPPVCGAAELCVYHGRRRGGEYELLLHSPGGAKEDFAARRSAAAWGNSAQEWIAGCCGRNHVVLAVLLLRLGAG